MATTIKQQPKKQEIRDIAKARLAKLAEEAKKPAHIIGGDYDAKMDQLENLGPRTRKLMDLFIKPRSKPVK